MKMYNKIIIIAICILTSCTMDTNDDNENDFPFGKINHQRIPSCFELFLLAVFVAARLVRIAVRRRSLFRCV